MIEQLYELNIYENIEKILEENLQDINTSRTSSRIIFPTFPDKKANYPTITLEITSPQYESVSAGDVFHTIKEDDIFIEYFAKKAKSNMNIYCFSSKEEIYNAVINNNVIALKGKNVSYYYAKQCLNILREKRKELLEFLNDIIDTQISDTFEDDKFGWTSVLNAEIIYDDIWCNKYVKGQLIESYSLTLNI
ncbi:MAG: hypothetical protein EOL97_13555 [Spirochaetia bacterium]|jgi:hypothetical protein|nr:hypothetical protein [Tissierellia bacterium]NCD07138.1 hypothetical protein [Spirochaetia bacterium]